MRTTDNNLYDSTLGERKTHLNNNDFLVNLKERNGQRIKMLADWQLEVNKAFNLYTNFYSLDDLRDLIINLRECYTKCNSNLTKIQEYLNSVKDGNHERTYITGIRIQEEITEKDFRIVANAFMQLKEYSALGTLKMAI